MFLASPLCPSILVRRPLFGFSADELSVVPRVRIFVLRVFVPRLLMLWSV